MAQFDVHRNTGRQQSVIPYVVIVQSSFYEKSRRRVVVPLVSLDGLGIGGALPESALNPAFEIGGRRVVLNPLEIVSVPVESLGQKVDSLAEESDAIIAALDELISRAWR